MSLSQQEDALVNALTKWLEERWAWAGDGPRGIADGSCRVIVCLDIAPDSLQYVITAQALIANMHLLKHVVRAVPKPTHMKTLIQAFARVDIQTHMKLSQKFNSLQRKSWYLDEANKLHKVLSFARRRWRRFRDGTLAGREGHPLSALLDAFDEAYDDDMFEFSTTTSTDSQHTSSTGPSIEIPAYPADHDVEFEELYAPCDECISISSNDGDMPALVIPPYPYNTEQINDIDPPQPEEQSVEKADDAEQPVDVTPAPKRRRSYGQSPRSPDSPECPEGGEPGANSRASLLSVLAQARVLPDAPKKSLVMKSMVPLEGVTMTFRVERVTNRFWRIQHDKVNIVQVTLKVTQISGAALLRDLVLYGVPKEGVEFIKRSGLLPPPL